MLPWGDIRSPGLAFWLTDSGDPDKWPVIAATDNGSYWDFFDGPACEFLLEVAAGRYDASGFRDAFRENGDRWISLSSRPIFTPFPAPAPAPPPMPSSEFWPTQAAGFSRWPPVNEMAWVRELIGDSPTRIPDVDWDQVHAQLGFRLPADYRAFIDTYGPGTLGDIRIMAPGQPEAWDLHALLNRKQAQGTILPLYPDPGGAIGWGETAGGDTLAWVPAGADPDGWLVVVIGPGAGLPDFNMGAAGPSPQRSGSTSNRTPCCCTSLPPPPARPSSRLTGPDSPTSGPTGYGTTGHAAAISFRVQTCASVRTVSWSFDSDSCDSPVRR